MRNLMILSFLGLAACGISDSTAVADLDNDDAQKICEEFDEREITCEVEGFEFTVTLGGDCDDATIGDVPEGCTATVGDYRDCQEAYAALSDEEVCAADDVPAACEPLFAESCVTVEAE